MTVKEATRCSIHSGLPEENVEMLSKQEVLSYMAQPDKAILRIHESIQRSFQNVEMQCCIV